MGKRYKYMDGYLSRDLLYQKIHPLRDAAFGAICLTSLRIWKIVTVGLRWILVMLSRIVTCYKNCKILICSPLKINKISAYAVQISS